jgi:hypothetical protein
MDRPFVALRASVMLTHSYNKIGAKSVVFRIAKN